MQDLTFGAETSSNIWFGWSDIGQTQSTFIKILIGEQVSETHVGGFVCDVGTELLLDHYERETRATVVLRWEY